jgi:hypothetical protein
MWFKKGELDAKLAELAARESDGLHPGAVDLLPAEDRYLDDGTLTNNDSETFGLRAGRPRTLPPICDAVTLPHTTDSIDALVRDVTVGRLGMLALIAATAACSILLAFAF